MQYWRTHLWWSLCVRQAFYQLICNPFQEDYFYVLTSTQNLGFSRVNGIENFSNQIKRKYLKIQGTWDFISWWNFTLLSIPGTLSILSKHSALWVISSVYKSYTFWFTDVLTISTFIICILFFCISRLKKSIVQPGVLMHTYNSSTWKKKQEAIVILCRPGIV